MASNSPEIGFVNNPVTPKAMPLYNPGVPFFSLYSLGSLYNPVKAS